MSWSIVSAADSSAQLEETYAALGLTPPSATSNLVAKLDEALITTLNADLDGMENKVGYTETLANELAGYTSVADSHAIPTSEPKWEETGAVSLPEVGYAPGQGWDAWTATHMYSSVADSGANPGAGIAKQKWLMGLPPMHDPKLLQLQNQHQANVAALDMKWKLLGKLHASKLGYSKVDLDRLGRHLDKAIAAGSTPEQIRTLAQSFVRMHMAEDQAEAATQECNALYAEFCEDRAKDILTVTAGTVGLAGMALEVGAYGVAAYMAGDDVSDAVVKSTLDVLPTQTTQCMYNYLYNNDPPISGYAVLGAALADGLNAFGLAGDIRSGHLFGEAMDWGGKMVDDMADAARKLPAAELDFAQGRLAGKQKVTGFMDQYEAAVQDAAGQGKTFNLEDYPDVKKAWWNVQQDGHAKQLINSDPDQVTKMFGKDKNDLVDAFNDATKQTYETGNDKLKNRLAEEYRKMGYNVDPKSIELPGATNPSKAKKISIDRDLTGKVPVLDEKGNITKMIEVPEDIMNKALGESLYDAAGRPSLDDMDPDGITKILYPNATDADRFRHLGDQVGVQRMGSEAYGHDVFQLQSATDYKSEIFANNMEFGNTFGHKGHEWMEKSEKIYEAAAKNTDPAQAARWRATAQAYAEESARQITKQWKNQVIPGIKEVVEMGHKLDVPIPKSPPRKLWDAMACMEKIGKAGPDGRLVTPELVNEQLKLMGYSGGMKDVTTKASGFLVDYEKAVGSNKELKAALMDKGLTDRINDTFDGKSGVELYNSTDVDNRGNK